MVAVPIFRNLSKEPQIEVFFTNALIAALERHSNVSVVSDGGNAQGLLIGEILSLEMIPAGRRQGGTLPVGVVLASEYRLVVRTRVSLVEGRSGQVLLSKELQRERSYVTPQVAQVVVNTVNALYNHSARQIHLEQLAKEMMEETAQLLVESF
ncbi:MAG: LPS assembly lipoprotein LptE [Bdellovibrionaceae bacterium]|nr:LPS assembly lipoprotein LptE [Pseudobdellovibrionaceae bacterium]MDW8191280.1 LPS assembly lipoprotein LptE [Pseudobdellovibrionaceae bacterium]